MQVDAGDYHVELVAKDTALAVYLHDENDKPVDAKGAKATGIFVIDGKPQRIELEARERQQADRHLSCRLAARAQRRRSDHLAERRGRTSEILIQQHSKEPAMTTLGLNRRRFLQSTMSAASAVALSSRWAPASAASPVLTVDTRTIEVNKKAAKVFSRRRPRRPVRPRRARGRTLLRRPAQLLRGAPADALARAD